MAGNTTVRVERSRDTSIHHNRLLDFARSERESETLFDGFSTSLEANGKVGI
jgi:hypothetical protein|tara:strand:- start:6746 stop:6901 length:156 start_codon:yes stop_codon:yes gene_type:complete